MVAQQPQGIIVLDQICKLPDCAGEAAADVRLTLYFAGGNAASAAVGHSSCQVYTVVLLLPDNAAVAPATTAVASAPDAMSKSQIAVGKPRCNIFAELPLLLLPAAAQIELEELFTAAVEQGYSELESYRYLLPLLRDWAMLLLPKPGGERVDTSNSSSRPTATYHEMLKSQAQELLLSFFDKANKLHCYKLIASEQQQEQRQQLSECNKQQQQLMLFAESAAGNATAATAGATSATAGQRSGAGNAAAAAQACKLSVSSRGCDSTAAAAAEPAAAGVAVTAIPAVTWKTVIFGFPDDAVCSAYNEYKAVALKQHALLFTCLYCLSMTGSYVRAVLKWRSMPTATGAAAAAGEAGYNPHHVEALSMAIKASLVTLIAATQLLLYLSACSVQQQHHHSARQKLLASLVHWRGTLVVVLMALDISIVYMMTAYGGIWRAATLTTFKTYHVSAFPLIMYNYILQPVILRISPIAMAVCCIMEVLWTDGLMPSDQLFWVHDVRWGAFMVMLAACQAAYWEFGMQKAFVAYCRANARSARVD